MSIAEVHVCSCDICQSTSDHPDKVLHHQINLLMSRLDEQQRRWYAAIEASRLGHGGIEQMAQITGLSVRTIRRGKRELQNNMADRPKDRVRLPGGGRSRVEKKTSRT
jgi:hypothetical protein